MPKHLLVTARASTFLVVTVAALSARAQTVPAPAPPVAPAPPPASAPPVAPASPPASAPPAAAAPPSASAPPEAAAPAPATPPAVAGAAEAATPGASAPPPAAPPAGAPAAGSGAGDSGALAALEAEAEAEAATAGPSFQLYGFADFTTRFLLKDSVGLGVIGAHSGTFSVGNLNLYGAADLTHGWRSLFEVRFLYVPNGALDPVTLQRVDTATADPADDNRPLHWAGIEIQRAYLEYTAHSLLTIRAGQFLTPYGIWNVDHGTPTIIPAAKPYPIGEHLFPDRQTGLEVYGSAALGDSSLGYHLTLSNGRGSSASYQDLDGNKAVGGRLFFTSHAAGTLTLGVSGYYGRSTEAGVTLDTVTFKFDQDITTQFDELAYAADVLWLWEGLHVQGEVMANDVRYTDRGRPAPSIPGFATPGGLVPDHRRIGGYGLAGYRLPWLTLMPFVLAEYFDAGTDVPAGETLEAGGAGALSFGLNARPIPTVALKGQFRHIFFKNGPARYVDDLLFSAAWSF